MTMPYYTCMNCKEEFLVKAFFVKDNEWGFSNSKGHRHKCDPDLIMMSTEPDWPMDKKPPPQALGTTGFTLTVVIRTDDKEMAKHIHDELTALIDDLRLGDKRIATDVFVGDVSRFWLP